MDEKHYKKKGGSRDSLTERQREREREREREKEREKERKRERDRERESARKRGREGEKERFLDSFLQDSQYTLLTPTSLLPHWMSAQPTQRMGYSERVAVLLLELKTTQGSRMYSGDGSPESASITAAEAFPRMGDTIQIESWSA